MAGRRHHALRPHAAAGSAVKRAGCRHLFTCGPQTCHRPHARWSPTGSWVEVSSSLEDGVLACPLAVASSPAPPPESASPSPVRSPSSPRPPRVEHRSPDERRDPRSRRWWTTPTASSPSPRASTTRSSPGPASPGSTVARGSTPADHDGMAVFDAGRGRYTLIQNHEIDPGAEFGVPHVAGTVYDPGATDAGGCTVITTDRRGPQPRRVRRVLRHRHQLRRRADPLGHVADLRGDRGPRRGHLGGGRPVRRPSRRTTATSSRSGPTAAPTRRRSSASDATRTRPSPSTRTARTSTCPRTPTGPTASSTAGPRRAASGSARASLTRLPDDAGNAGGDADHHGRRHGAARRRLPDLRPARPPVPGALDRGPRPRRADHAPSASSSPTAEVTRGRKFEGVWGTDAGVYVVNSYAWEDGDLPADAVPHDGMVWFYDYRAQTIQLVTYFPHQPTTEDGVAGEVQRPHLRRPRQRHRHPVGQPRARRGRRRRLPRARAPSRAARRTPSPATSSTTRSSAGPTFSADGKVLFVNMQDPGLTLAITGPWAKYLG